MAAFADDFGQGTSSKRVSSKQRSGTSEARAAYCFLTLSMFSNRSFRSAGIGATISISSCVAGWWKATRSAWSACLGNPVSAAASDAVAHLRKSGAAVDRVADDRQARGGQVDADLVRAAGHEPAPQQGDPERGPLALDLVERARGRAFRPEPRRRSRGTPSCACDRADRVRSRARPRPCARGGRPATTREVLLLQRAAAHLPREHLVGAVGLRDEEHAGGVAVQPVHDSGPELAADPGEVAHVVQQRVDQRPGGVARSGMDDEPGRLVDREELARPRRGWTAGSPRPRAGSRAAPRPRRSPPRRPARDATARASPPSTRTAPSSISFWMRERERSEQAAARKRSSRVPAEGEPT